MVDPGPLHDRAGPRPSRLGAPRRAALRRAGPARGRPREPAGGQRRGGRGAGDHAGRGVTLTARTRPLRRRHRRASARCTVAGARAVPSPSRSRPPAGDAAAVGPATRGVRVLRRGGRRDRGPAGARLAVDRHPGRYVGPPPCCAPATCCRSGGPTGTPAAPGRGGGTAAPAAGCPAGARRTARRTGSTTRRRGTLTVRAVHRVGAVQPGRPAARGRRRCEHRRPGGGELPSEGLVLGAVQVPPSGQPLVFLHDHPTTGGYPVHGGRGPADDLWQLRAAAARRAGAVRARLSRAQGPASASAARARAASERTSAARSSGDMVSSSRSTCRLR